MNDRSVKTTVTLEAPLEHNENAIRIDVYHDKGGPNYFSGGYTKAGYWLSVGAIEIQEQDGMGIVTERLAIGGGGYGVRFFIAPAARFNAKKLAAVAAQIHAHDATIAAHVVTRNHPAIKEVVTAAAAAVFGSAVAA